MQQEITQLLDNSEQKKEMSCLVDWLSFTIQDNSNYNVDLIITDVLKCDKNKFVKLQKGHHGYKSQCAYDNIRIYSDGQEGMGIHIQMSGSGCRKFEEFYTGTWKDFFTHLSSIGVNISRLDLAIDDTKGYLDLDLMIEKTKKNELVTRFRDYQAIISGMFEYKNQGKTLYLGSPSSDVRFRIYDKSFETGKKMLSSPDEVTRSLAMTWVAETHWIRFEAQFRDEMATSIFEHLASNNDDDFFKVVAGIIKDKLRFVEPSSDSNKRRWKESQFWNTFLEGVEKLKISKKPKKKNLDESLAQFERQYGPSLAVYFTYFDGDIKPILDIIYKGKTRMKSKHYELLKSVT